MRVYYCLFLFAFAACNPSGFKGISRGIQKECQYMSKTAVKKLDHQNRMKLFDGGMFNFLNLQQDTILLMAKTRIQTGQRVYRIWNKQGELNYSYTHPNLNSGENLQFSPRNVELITSWDTLSLRKEEANRATTFHELSIQAARVIIKDGKWQISCINFTEF